MPPPSPKKTVSTLHLTALRGDTPGKAAPRVSPPVKIVTLSTYPVSRPFHGGQRRLDAILRVLRGAGHEVSALPVFFGDNYADHDPIEARTALSADLLHRLHDKGQREDLHMHHLLAPGTPAFDAICQRLHDLAPDAVQFEHPWLFPLLDHLPGRDHLKIIYSAHNIETDLMPDRFRAQTRALEQAAARRADLVIAVSAEDAAVLNSWRAPELGGKRGGGQSAVVVAPNGSWPPALDASVPRPLAQDYLLLVGSSHPPNVQGYWEGIGKIPGCIPPDARLVVAGGMGDLLQRDPRHRHFRLLNDHLVHVTGRIEEERLQAFLTHAKGICLPITTGGGTNLKTAEALLSLKPVIAMRPAFRGFDAAVTLSGVHLADTAQAFRAGVRDLFAGRLTSARSAGDVARYTWEATLADLPPAYARLTDPILT